MPLGQDLTTGLKDVDDCFEQSLDLLDQHQFRALFRQVVACAFQLKSVHCFRAVRSFGIALAKAKYAETADIVAASLMEFSKEFHFIEIDGIIEYLQFLERLLREGPKAISQFSLEMTLSLGRKILQAEVQNIAASPQQSEALFLSLLRVISSILLYHRHRISGRHHLISGIFVELLKSVTLPVPGRPVCASWIQQYTSDENLIPRARGLERLVSNLCEPPSHAVRDRAGMSRLSSTKAAVSRVLSKHLPLLLVAYVDTSLNYGFPASVKDIMRVAFYPVFDILGPEGVANAGAFLDSSGRAYLRPAYDDYKRNGKWQD
jgi:nucleolar pre-ribosomal-associated protein 2